MKRTYVSHVSTTKPVGGMYVPGEGNKHVVDLGLTVARVGPHNGGAGRAAIAQGRPEIGKHAPEEITKELKSCGEALRQNAQRAG